MADTVTDVTTSSSVSYSSSKPSVATVDGNGAIRAVASGSAVVTARYSHQGVVAHKSVAVSVAVPPGVDPSGPADPTHPHDPSPVDPTDPGHTHTPHVVGSVEGFAALTLGKPAEQVFTVNADATITKVAIVRPQPPPPPVLGSQVLFDGWDAAPALTTMTVPTGTELVVLFVTYQILTDPDRTPTVAGHAFTRQANKFDNSDSGYTGEGASVYTLANPPIGAAQAFTMDTARWLAQVIAVYCTGAAGAVAVAIGPHGTGDTTLSVGGGGTGVLLGMANNATYSPETLTAGTIVVAAHTQIVGQTPDNQPLVWHWSGDRNSAAVAIQVTGGGGGVDTDMDCPIGIAPVFSNTDTVPWLGKGLIAADSTAADGWCMVTLDIPVTLHVGEFYSFVSTATTALGGAAAQMECFGIVKNAYQVVYCGIDADGDLVWDYDSEEGETTAVRLAFRLTTS